MIRPTRGSAPSSRPLLPISLFFLLIQTASSIYSRMLHNIRATHSQCIYNRFDAGDFATFELFIIDSDVNGRPEAAVTIEGPVAGAYIGVVDVDGNRSWGEAERVVSADGRTVNRKTTMGRLIQESTKTWPKYVAQNRHNFQKIGLVHIAFHIDYTHAGESEDAVAARAEIARQRNDHSQMEREKRVAEQGRRAEGHYYTGEENVEDEKYEDAGSITQVIPETVAPYEWTKPIKAPGWYRLCVQAGKSIAVEMDIRSSADLGGVDEETGHVFTHDKREELLEDARILEPSAEEAEEQRAAEELEQALKQQVRDDDMDATRLLMKEVRGLVTQIQMRQQESFHRMKFQEGYTKRNNAKISKSGMIETGLYLVITLCQMYTLRKWLLSNNVLGR